MMRNFWKNEQGDTNFIAMVIMIAVVIILVILFGPTVTSIIEGLLSKF